MIQRWKSRSAPLQWISGQVWSTRFIINLRHAPEYISRDLRACAEIVSNLDAKMLQLNEAILEEKEKEEQKKKEE